MKEKQFPFYERHDGLKAPFCYAEPDRVFLSVAKAYIPPRIPSIFLQHGNGDEIIPMQQSIDVAPAAEEIVEQGWESIENEENGCPMNTN